MSTQWHPLFARLPGVQLGEFYEIQTEVPVSDLPRVGDFLIIRRLAGREPPFRGLWNHLSDWNVLEFKGPTDDPEVDDLEKLAHVGTGITYKLNEERRARSQERLENRQVSFWYIARALGDTFLAAARARSSVAYEGGGLYSCRCWGHPLFLVSARDAPVEEDTVPLWLVEGTPAPRALGEFVVKHEELVQRFATWLMRLQPALWQEIRGMAEFSSVIDWAKVAKVLDPEVLRHFPPEQVAEILGPDLLRHLPAEKVSKLFSPELIRHLPAEKVVEALGPELLRHLSAEKVVEALGPERMVAELLKRMSREQVQELLQRQAQQNDASPAEAEEPKDGP